MVTKKVKIQLENGLDARPVAMLVQVASKFDSRIYLLSDGKKVNAKSIMGMMSLGLDNGEELEIMADGKDEKAAADALEQFLSSKEA
ncbi:MAG: HPr family phosphocarrier protein [Acetatifactor sp.]|nr:HPr family phosphocarrier protein [Acetatifactor sp.]